MIRMRDAGREFWGGREESTSVHKQGAPNRREIPEVPEMPENLEITGKVERTGFRSEVKVTRYSKRT